uniref:ORF9 n=1 Tax=Alphacoronavirus sp. TaxID=1906673 RepID=A0A8F0ZUC5_9ALPC|nr:ORF9 [Alphacoronavirus sp.]QWN56374.1 ORF9 [Alphacoronavirus sp.]QWN56383.1 ORF9 [Alphacoronavirus sp.]QWN56392.1 ORF9 [Alphacoronavirus sp.]
MISCSAICTARGSIEALFKLNEMLLLLLFPLCVVASPSNTREVHWYIDCIQGTSAKVVLPCGGTLSSNYPIEFVPDPNAYGLVAIRCVHYYEIQQICPRGNFTFHIKPVSYKTHRRYGPPEGNMFVVLLPLVTTLAVLILFFFVNKHPSPR